MGTVGVLHFAVNTTSLMQGSSHRAVLEARLAAESGLGFFVRRIEDIEVSGSLRGQALLGALATQLGTAMDNTANLNGQSIGYDGVMITIPSISLTGRKTFSAQITAPNDDTLRLTVTGTFTTGSDAAALAVTRRITLDFMPVGNPIFGFALASEGPITMGMNSEFLGVAQPSDGSMYSKANFTAIDIGSGHVTGDLCISDPLATMSVSGVQVDGQKLYDVPPIDMPTIDRSVYEPLATNVVDSSTNFSSGTFDNIRIKAGTNPVFGSVTIRGVMYVEAPNNIEFKNNVNFTGVLVAEDPPVGSPDSANYIYFKNNASFNGVEDLPDEPQFAQVRTMAGSTVLAPGFTMEFKNNFGSIAGVMAVKNLIAKNNLDATVYGSVLIYGTAGLTFKNNSTIRIDHSRHPGVPPGFEGYGRPPLSIVPDSYVEP